MKRGSRPAKVDVICSLANVMTFWAADLIRHSLRSPAWEAAQKDAAPSSSSPQQAHPLFRISFHHTKPRLEWDFTLLLQLNTPLHASGVIQPGPEIQVVPPPLFVPASSRWILIPQLFDLLSLLVQPQIQSPAQPEPSWENFLFSLRIASISKHGNILVFGLLGLAS